MLYELIRFRSGVLLCCIRGPYRRINNIIQHSSLPCFASELTDPSGPVSDKINIESILLAIDDFFNKNPFFVAGCTFIYLIVLPLVEEYLKKYKYISAINAFRKLKNDARLPAPSSWILGMRRA